MIKTLQVIVLVGLLITSANVYAKAGSVIPKPQISISEAISIAQDYFYNKETRIIDGELFKAKDYLIISVRYVNNFDDNINDNDWAWEVTFTHPMQNDHSVIYKIMKDKKIFLLHATE